MKEKIVFFGGTFDPPHTEHIAELKAALEETGAVKAVVMPTADPPHKDTFYKASGEHRLEMCRMSFGDLNAEVSDYEIKKGGKSYSYETLEHLKSVYPDKELLFLMGTDMLESFKSWKNPERILRCAKPLLCERTGDDEKKEVTLKRFERDFGRKALALNYVGKELSSTEIKLRIMR